MKQMPKELSTRTIRKTCRFQSVRIQFAKKIPVEFNSSGMIFSRKFGKGAPSSCTDLKNTGSLLRFKLQEIYLLLIRTTYISSGTSAAI